LDLTNLHVDAKARENNVKRCRERGIVIPTLSQQKCPERIPQTIVTKIKDVNLWDVAPVNLFRITWKNEPKGKGGVFGKVNRMVFPPELTGVEARIVALVGKWFPTGSHKVGAAFGCLVPTLITGNFDSTRQRAVWPSTGNFCRGGAYNSALLGCESVAVLPEEMSRERFDWLSRMAGEVIVTPGGESSVKEVLDRCRELKREHGNRVVIFNQFEEFGNYLWHYEVTGNAAKEVVEEVTSGSKRAVGFVSLTGSSGTIAAGDFLKQNYPELKICAGEALQCPTLLSNGFGGHRIEGIGDKHVPWIHNVRNTDLVIAVDDQDCMDVVRLFNEPKGKEYLDKVGVDEATVNRLHLLGISGIGNLLAAIKFSKYYELSSSDVVATVLTDSMELYESRLSELQDRFGALTREDAARIMDRSISHQKTDNMIEPDYRQRKRIHNLKYYTWVEQRGKSAGELNRQWYDPGYWTDVQRQAAAIDELVVRFNEDVGLQY